VSTARAGRPSSITRGWAVALAGILAFASVLVPADVARAGWSCDLVTVVVDGDNYFEVGTAADLMKIGMSCPDDEFYVLVDDLLLLENWAPIADFQGILDGDGFTITWHADAFGSLFTDLTGAEVRNLRLEGFTFDDADAQTTGRVGALAGIATSGSLVENVHVSEFTIVARRDANAGALIGEVSGSTLQQVTVHQGSIEGEARVGGAVGVLAEGSIVRDVVISETTVLGRSGVGDPNENGRIRNKNIGGLVGGINADGGEILIQRISLHSMTISGVQEVVPGVGGDMPNVNLGGLLGRISADGGDLTIVDVEVRNASITVATAVAVRDVSVGGLVGTIAGEDLDFTVRRSAVDATIDVQMDKSEMFGAGFLFGHVGGEDHVIQVFDFSGRGSLTVDADQVEEFPGVGGLIGTVSVYTPADPALGEPADVDLRLERAYAAVSVELEPLDQARSYYLGGLIGVVFDERKSEGDADAVLTLPRSGVTVTNSFWAADASTPALESTWADAGTKSNVAEMRLLNTFADADWAIVADWQAFDADTFDANTDPVWGICGPVNAGFPFLLWVYDEDPCIELEEKTLSPTTSSSTGGPGLACSPAPAPVGATVTCVVSGGPVDHEMLWQARTNPTFAGGGVQLDGEGNGSFSFVVPRAALGGAVVVELVGWGSTVSVTVGGPVPASVPAGSGPVLPLREGLAVLMVALFGLGWMLRREHAVDVVR